MATKSEKQVEAVEKVEAVEAAAPAPYDPWTDMRKIALPKARKGEDATQYVAINGRVYYVPRNGRQQDVPYPIYEALLQMLDAEDEDERFRAEEIPHEAVPEVRVGSQQAYIGI